jgi:hypothetical protein
MGQVSVRVTPPIAWMFDTTSLPSSSMLAYSTTAMTIRDHVGRHDTPGDGHSSRDSSPRHASNARS